MPSIALTGYQSKAVDTLTHGLLRLLDADPTEDRLVVLKAPTGSGKTVILGATLKSLAEQTSTPFVALWLTPGRGSLQKQSAERLANMLSDAGVSVYALDRPFLSTNVALPDRSVLIVNWEKITEQKAGKWTNNLTRTGEQRNLFEALTATAKMGTNLIVIVDESHTHISGPQSKSTMEAIRAICPFIQLDASATPTKLANPEKMGEDGTHAMVLVKRAEVVEAGMIVKGCVLNPGLDEGWDTDKQATVQQRVLSSAWQRRDDMENAYKGLGSPVVPLLLVQLPDGPEAADRQAAVESFLDMNNVPASQRAVWLDKDKTDNLIGLSENTSQVRVLLFKQAIATGWDCPRAAVLVQFRDIKSKTFQLQTVGRICRMPERTHYEEDLLNFAYVYTLADDGEGVEVEMLDPETPFRDLQLALRPGLYPDTGLMLTSIYQPLRRLYDYIPASIDHRIGGLLDRKFADLPHDPADVVFERSVVFDVELDLTATSGRERVLTGRTLSAIDDEARLEALFNRLLTSDIAPYSRPNSNRERIRRGVALWFQRNRSEYSDVHIRNVCLARGDELVGVISAACHAVAEETIGEAERTAKGTRKTTKAWEIYGLPDSNLVESAKTEDMSRFYGCLTDPALIAGELSEPERLFIATLSKLHSSGIVKWWWKNPENTEAGLGLRRSDDLGGDHGHYPDFLVMDTGGVLWVLEVKDTGDKDAGNRHRASALAIWAEAENTRARENLFGPAPKVRAGLVVPYEKADTITLYIADPDNWQDPDETNLRRNIGWSELVFRA